MKTKAEYHAFLAGYSFAYTERMTGLVPVEMQMKIVNEFGKRYTDDSFETGTALANEWIAEMEPIYNAIMGAPKGKPKK